MTLSKIIAACFLAAAFGLWALAEEPRKDEQKKDQPAQDQQKKDDGKKDDSKAKDEGKKDEPKSEPYKAEITAKRVNVRSGPGTNYHSLFKASKGYVVIVRGVEGEWARLQVPAGCLLWIHRDYVDLDEASSTGRVTGDNVNVRIAPVEDADIVGQVSEGVQVCVTGEEGQWYEIKGPDAASLWVHTSYIKRLETDK